MTRLYRRCCRSCRTVNQLSKVHIALENRMTPLDAATLYRDLMAMRGWSSALAFWPTRVVALARCRFPTLLRWVGRGAEHALHQRRWIRRLHGMQARGGEGAAPEPFVRQRLGHAVTRYSAGGALASERAARTLVVAFTGSSARLMLPTPVFLQQLDAHAIDLVLVRYPAGRGFVHGLLPPPDDSLFAAIDRIGALARPADYGRTVAFGTSGGALPALIAARRLGLDGAVAVGSKGPDDPRWLRALGVSASDAVRGAPAAPEPAGVWLVVGADHPRDRDAARAWSALLPSARVVSISDDSGLVGHNPLVPLLRRGELRPLLARALFDTDG